jgi:hypothetical protein
MRVFITALVQPFHIETFKQIKKIDPNFECVLATGLPLKKISSAYTGNEFRELFPAAHHATTDTLMFPSSIYKLKAKANHLNNQVLVDTKDIESLFYRLTDRTNIHPIPVAQKRQMYLILLNYMLDLFDRFPFDLVITLNYPHSFFEIIGIELAKYLNKKVIRLSWHTSQNFSLITNDYGYPHLPPDFSSQYDSIELEDIELPVDLKNALEEAKPLSKDFAEREAKRQKLLIKNNWKGQMSIKIRLYKKIFTSLIRMLSPALLGTHNTRIIEETILSDNRNDRKYRWKIIKNLRHLSKLHLYYNKVSETVDTNKKFIFFALHMQPEQTTLPFGGEFDDHLPAIEMIAESLPEGWVLYVKEHPEQFRIHRPSNGMFRSKAFYDRIKSLPNTYLLSLDHNPKELISKSQSVSTITGTVGWEALKIGKPVIIFAECYYSTCESAFVVDSVSSCKKALEQIKSLSKNDVQKHLAISQLFLHQNGSLVRCAAWEDILYTYDDSYEQQTLQLAQKIIELKNEMNASL